MTWSERLPLWSALRGGLVVYVGVRMAVGTSRGLDVPAQPVSAELLRTVSLLLFPCC